MRLARHAARTGDSVKISASTGAPRGLAALGRVPRRDARRPALVVAALDDDAAEALASAAAPSVALPDLPISPDAATKALSGALSSATDVTSQLTGKASDLAGAAGAATSQAAAAAASAAEGLKGSLSGFAGGAGGLADSVTGAVGGVGGAVGGAVGGVAAGASSALAAAKAQLGEGLGAVTAGLGGATATATDALGQATAVAGGALGQASEVVTGTTRAATEAFNSVFGEATGALQGAADTAAGAAADHPQAAAIAAAAVGVPAVASWYAGRFGGFAGEVSPEVVSALLADEDAVLIDIRPLKQREAEGTPELKLGARFKVAALPVEDAGLVVPPRVARQAGDANGLRTLVAASLVAGLKQVKGPMTRVVVMDRDGGDAARALARALTTLGQPRAYVMTGGFRGWRDAAELPVSEATDYVADAGALLADSAEAVVAELSNPAKGIPLAGGAVLGGVALLNYHTTLEFIGVLGTLLLVAKKATSYGSLQEALDDVGATVAKAKELAGSVKVPALPKAPAGGVGGGASSNGAGGPRIAAPKLPAFGGLPRPAVAPKAAGGEGGIKDGAISDVATAGADDGSA